MANAKHLKILKEGAAAWNQWRRKSSEEARDGLFRSDLSEADLFNANLIGADLRKADLSGTNLIRADLNRADLSGADLSKAYLHGADLHGTNLSEAHLSGGLLSRAELREANLSRADLSGACLGHTVFCFTSLKSVKGLATCQHTGPSSLDYATLMASGPLPEIFLRGCGLSDAFIQYLPSFWNQPIQFYSCFISYSHDDKPFARRLYDSLQGQGIRCWLDEKQLLPGDHIHQAVDEAVRLWDKVLLCCSKTSLGSWWVDKEISKALKKEERLWKERGKQVLAIIPLNLDGFMFEQKWDDWKRQHLTDRLAADFTGWELDDAKFEEQIERVVKALRADAATRQPPPSPKL